MTDTTHEQAREPVSRRRFLQVAGAGMVVAAGGATAHFSMLPLPASAQAATGGFRLHILHINDLHSRIEAVSRFDNTCPAADAAEDKCFGGVGRLATKLWERREALRAAGANVVTLDAGDQFQGSLFHTAYKGRAEGEFMNRIGFDAMALGNHEFDSGPDVLADFVDLVEFPVISGNVVIGEAEKLAGKVREWTILEAGGEKVGVLSVLTPATATLSSPGPNIGFLDEIEYLKDAVARIRAAGVGKVLLLSHVGFARDLEIAAQVDGIAAIVGGHSHTLLSNTVEGAPAYATMVENPSGRAVPIVQAYAYSKYLGEIALTLDEDGYVTEAAGDTILLDASVEPDAGIEARIRELSVPIETLKNTPVGEVAADIDGSRESCRARECEMGNAITDAMLARLGREDVTIAIQNGGGVRASIGAGAATVGDVLSVLPFQNTLATMKLHGDDIVASLEHGVSGIEEGAGRFPQVSGLRYTLDLSVAPGAGRIASVEVMENGGWAPIDPDRLYGVATNDFMRKGGDGYALFAANAVDPYDYGPGLEEVLAEYIAVNSPFRPKLDGRIIVTGNR